MPRIRVHRAGAFTLIELLTVIVIVALLVGILAPSLVRIPELARITVCGSNMRQLSTGVTAYRAENDDLAKKMPEKLSELTSQWKTLQQQFEADRARGGGKKLGEK